MKRTNRTLLPLIALVLAALNGIVTAHEEPAYHAFKPMAARATANDWTKHGCTPELNAAIQAYEKTPTMATAIGVLEHYPEFYRNEKMRKAILAADPVLFGTVDVAKHEIVMQVRKRLPGVKWSRRVGSSGAREAAIIEWVAAGRPADWFQPGGKLELKPNKQFYSDDDITNYVDGEVALADPTAHERVNGSAAEELYLKLTRDEMGKALDPKLVQTEFLSPTKAWGVLKNKFARRGAAFSGADAGPAVDPWQKPNFLFALNASNAEKYNDLWGVDMLEHWGYDKGYVTPDVQQPLISKTVSSMGPRPEPPKQIGAFAYIADNYRQIYVVHKGKFLSQCKYLLRMMEAWESVSTRRGFQYAQAFPPGWQNARDAAAAFAISGENSPGAADFKARIGGIIDSVVIQLHNYHMERVATAILEASKKLKPTPERPATIQEMINVHPDLADETDGLLVAYTNIPAEVHQQLMQHFADQIRDGETAREFTATFKSEIFKQIMQVVQDETDITRGHIEAFRDIREKVSGRLSENLTAVDLDRFLEEVAKGKFTRKKLTLSGDRVTAEDRPVDPRQVQHDIELIHGQAREFGWSNELYAERLKEYFNSADPEAAIKIVQRIEVIFDSSPAAPVTVNVSDPAGGTLIRQVIPTGRKLGVQLFKLAVKGNDIWGKVSSGKDLYTNLYSIFWQGGLSDYDIGQAQASIFAAAINIEDMLVPDGVTIPKLGKTKLQWAGVWTSNLASTAMTNLGAVGIDQNATQDLLYAAFKDLATLYSPNLAAAIAVYELANWGYKQWEVSSSQSKLVDALVENGRWKPANVRELIGWEKTAQPGDIPKCEKILDGENGTVHDVSEIAKHSLAKVTLIQSKTDIVPRRELLDVAYYGGTLEADPVMAVSIDALKQISGTGTVIHLGLLPKSTRDWNKEMADNLGLLIPVQDDQRPAKLSDIQVGFDPGKITTTNKVFAALHDAGPMQMRLVGRLLMDFWKKQQSIMEESTLPAVLKEAGRRYLDKLKEQQAEASKYDFNSQIEEIYDNVADVDKSVWPLIAPSAQPFAPETYDPDLHTPILDAFRNTDRVKTLVSEIKQLEEFLQDPSRLELQLYETVYQPDGPARIPTTYDRKSALTRANERIKDLRDYHYKLYDGYEQVKTSLEEASTLTSEGKSAWSFRLKPYHISLSPLDWSLWAVLSEGTTPVRGDIDRAKKYVNLYKDVRRRVAQDVADRTKNSPPGSLAYGLWEDIQRMMGLDIGDISGSPTHPLWPQLINLRYQIQKLEKFKEFRGKAYIEEYRDMLSSMKIKPDKDMDIPSSFAPPDQEELLRNAIDPMEEQYRKLLDQLTNMFEITLSVSPADPFLCQEATVTAKPKFPDGPAPKLGGHGFPSYVARFRWIAKDESGTVLETREPDLSKGENPAEWKPKFKSVGKKFVELQALDVGGNRLASASVEASPKPLTFRGSVVLAEGDHTGEPIRILAGGSALGELSQFGAFSFEIPFFDETPWTAQALVYVTEKYSSTSSGGYLSNSSSIDFNPAGGLLVARDALRLKLPFSVGVTVEVKDKAARDVKGADVRILMGGSSKAQSQSATLKIDRGESVEATVDYAPLNISQNIAPVTFNPDAGRELKLKAELPILEAGSLTIRGQFVPDSRMDPRPRLASGDIQASLGNFGVGDQGVFSFTNPDPIDLRNRPQFSATAVVRDSANKVYKPKSEPIKAAIPERAELDLGAIVVGLGATIKPITAQLFDWTGKQLAPADGAFLIDGSPAANNNGTFTGEYTFLDEQKEIVLEGRHTLQDGQTVSARATITLAKLGGFANPQAPPMYQFKLPFYAAGNLQFQGATKPDQVPPGRTGPSRAKLQDTKHAINFDEAIGNFSFSLSVPIRIGDSVFLEAIAKEGNLTYRGSAFGSVTDRIAPVDFGEINLLPGSSVNSGEEITRLVFGPPCDYTAALNRAKEILRIDPADEWLTRNYSTLEQSAQREPDAKRALAEAEALIANRDVDRAVTVLENAYSPAPDCWQREIRTRLEHVTTADKRVRDLSRQAEQFVAQCKFSEAMRPVNEIEQISPQHPWLITEKPKIVQADRDLTEARALALQAKDLAARQGSNADQVVALARRAMDKAPACGKREIADNLRGIRLTGLVIDTSIILLIDTSGSMGDNDKIVNAKAAATQTVSRASDKTEMALLAYDGGCGGGWHVVQDFTGDASALTAAISSLRPGGGTPTAPAIAFALQHMKDRAKGRQQQILLLTDGQNDCGSMADAGNSVRQSQIKVDAIGFGVATGSQAQNDLNLIVANGGRAYNATNGKELIKAFNRAFLLDTIKPVPSSAALGPRGSAVQASFDRAQSFIKADDFEGAAREYEAALQAQPNLAAAHYNLSIAMEQQDQILGATAHAQRYLDLEPNAFDRNEVAARIQALEQVQRERPHAIFDPGGCADIYNWARTETEAVKKKGPAIRARVMEIMIAAQKGDCEKARTGYNEYKGGLQGR